jgi:cytochrome d ubiquinol oxidase subunit I
MLLGFVILYLVISIGIGVYAATKVKTTEDYFSAGRSLPMVIVVAMVFATWVGAETVLGIPATFLDENLGGTISDPFGASLALILFGLPDREAATVHGAVEVPKLSSLILKHDPNAPLAGLDTVARADWPPVEIVFWSFRVMVGLGMAMLLLGLWGLYALLRKRLYDAPWLHRFALIMGPMGFVAVLAGWITTEVGRQPWTVYGLLRTADSAAPLAAPAVATSLAAFAVVYFTVFGAGVFYILRLMSHAPHRDEPGVAETPIRTAGITPAPAIDPDRPIPTGEETDHER